MAEERRRTTSRRELARQSRFVRLSPLTGELDGDAFDQSMDEDADATLGLLADLAGATDPRLRELARALAGRVMVRLGRAGPPRAGGVGRLRGGRWADGGDVDVDASLEEIVSARSGRRPVDLEEMRSRHWARPATGICMLVDRSGSMGGQRLASGALAAAAVAWRAPDDYSVVAFSDEAVVVKAQDEIRPVEAVVDDLLGLRGHGTTNLDLALSVARAQLERSRSRDRLVLLLSDGRATTGPDPAPAARALDRLLVLAPAGDSREAAALARSAGGRTVELGGPSTVPAALAALIGG